MKPDKQLVRRLRTAVRAAVRTNPVLRRQHKKPPGIWRRQLGWPTLRGVVPLVLFGAGWLGAPVSTLLAYGALWTLCVLFSRATRLATPLGSHEALWTYYQLPVSNAAVFRLLTREWFLGSLWLALDWAALAAGLALRQGGLLPVLLIPLLAETQWAVHISLAAWAVRRWPRLPYGAGLFLTGVLFFACVQSYEKAWAQAAFIGPTLKFALYLTPGGWLGQNYLAAAAGSWPAWFGLVALGTICALLIRPAITTMEAGFRMEPLFGYGSSDSATPDQALVPPRSIQIPAEDTLEPAGPDLSRLPAPDSAQIRARLRELLSRPSGHVLANGTVESLIRHTLTRRQQHLLEQLRPNPPLGWSRGWVFALGGIVLARLLLLAGLDAAWCGIFVAVTVGVLGLPAFGGMWSGLEAAGNFQYSTGLQAYLPVGFWESVRLMLQINLVRLFAGLPLLLLAVKFGFTDVPLSWTEAWHWSWRVLALLAALQPIWCIVAYSKNTNDSSARWWFATLLVFAIFSGLFILIGGGVALFSVSETGPALAIGGALILFFSLLLFCYGLAYRFGVFDQMKLNR